MAFQYRRTITVDHTKVPNTDQTNFPVLVSFTDATFKNTSSGGHVESVNGYDINFYSDSSATTKLKWEMESYNSATGAVVAWVLVTSLSHTSDNVFYVFYGDAAIVTFQGDINGTWNSNFKGVWHLGAGLAYSNDSTSNGNNGTTHGSSQTTGQIDGAGSFNGTTDYIDNGAGSSLNLTANSVLTISCWFNLTAKATAGNYPIFAGIRNASNDGYWLEEQGDAGNINFVTHQVGTYYTCGFAESGISTGTWYHLVGVFSGTGANQQKIYLNGTQQATITGSYANPSYNFLIAKDPVGSTWFTNGKIDEVRFLATDVSADWVATEYNNQSSPSTFFTLGSETPIGGVTFNATLLTATFSQFTPTVTGNLASNTLKSLPYLGVGS